MPRRPPVAPSELGIIHPLSVFLPPPAHRVHSYRTDPWRPPHMARVRRAMQAEGRRIDRLYGDRRHAARKPGDGAVRSPGARDPWYRGCGSVGSRDQSSGRSSDRCPHDEDERPPITERKGRCGLRGGVRRGAVHILDGPSGLGRQWVDCGADVRLARRVRGDLQPVPQAGDTPEHRHRGRGRGDAAGARLVGGDR